MNDLINWNQARAAYKVGFIEKPKGVEVAIIPEMPTDLWLSAGVVEHLTGKDEEFRGNVLKANKVYRIHYGVIGPRTTLFVDVNPAFHDFGIVSMLNVIPQAIYDRVTDQPLVAHKLEFTISMFKQMHTDEVQDMELVLRAIS